MDTEGGVAAVVGADVPAVQQNFGAGIDALELQPDFLRSCVERRSGKGGAVGAGAAPVIVAAVLATYYAKPGATVRSSASMTLEEQFALMKEFYDRGLFIVRLHTGDPCIYGAIQEQMAFFDRYGMRYRITPGISSFLAAAAALRSQFTIPEKVQSIILTRGEGRTPMPEKEKLHLLAW